MNATPLRGTHRRPDRGRIPLTPRHGPAELAFEARARRPFGEGLFPAPSAEERIAEEVRIFRGLFERIWGREVTLLETCERLDQLDAQARRCNPHLFGPEADGGAL